MRWTLNVNQKQSLCLGIKNINQSIILGLICECHSWAEAVLIDGQVFYWTSRQSFSKELPLLDLKADTIYRHLKTLEQLGLIEYKKDGKKDCVRLTKLGKSYYVGNESEFSENSEMNPTKLGNESENNSEMNPTYPNTISNHNTNKIIYSDFVKIFSFVDEDSFIKMISHLKTKHYNLTKHRVKNNINKLINNPDLFKLAVDKMIELDYSGLFIPSLTPIKKQYEPTKSKMDVTMETYERVQEMKRQQAGKQNVIDGEIV